MKNKEDNTIATFIIKYNYAKNKAKSIMESGDINSYLKQLFELNQYKKQVKTLLPKIS